MHMKRAKTSYLKRKRPLLQRLRAVVGALCRLDELEADVEHLTADELDEEPTYEEDMLRFYRKVENAKEVYEDYKCRQIRESTLASLSADDLTVLRDMAAKAKAAAP